MKIWTLESKRVQGLYTWVCYCEENPAQLIYSEEYEDLLNEVLEELYEGFSYYDEPHWEEEYEDWEDMDQEERDEILQEFMNEWKDSIVFEAYEVSEPEHFPVLIDERAESNI